MVLAPIDWTNAVFVAAVVAMWTTVVTTRLSGVFRSAKIDAVIEIALLRKTLSDASSYLEGRITLSVLLEASVITLAGEDQWNAARLMKAIALGLRKHFKAEFDAAAAASGCADTESFAGKPWRDAQFKIINESRVVLGKAVQEIDEIRPNYWRVFGLWFRNRTLNKIDRFLGQDSGKPPMEV